MKRCIGLLLCLFCIYVQPTYAEKSSSQSLESQFFEKGKSPDELKQLILKGMNIHSIEDGWWKRSTLHYVLAKVRDENKALELVQLLLDRGINVNAKDELNRNALFYTAHVPTLRLLLKNGADPYAVDNLQEMPFFSALESEKDLKQVQEYIQQGTDVNRADSNGITPLMIAAKFKEPDITKFLLTKGANIHAQDKAGFTALIHAAKEGYPDAVEVLIRAGANLNSVDQEKMTPLMWSMFKRDPENAFILMKHGVRINLLDKYGQSALFHALENGHLEIAKQLVALGANLPSVNQKNQTPLIKLAGNPRPEDDKVIATIDYLLEKGFDINARDNNGNTALFMAQTEAVLKHLIKQGAKVAVQNNRGDTPLTNETSRYSSPEKKANLIILLKHGANVNAQDHEGNTPLLLAESEELQKLFIEWGADVNLNNNKGIVPLHHAKNIELIKLLLNKGANVNIKDKNGWNALNHYSLRLNDEKIADKMELLLKKGIDPNVKGFRSFTPLMQAVDFGRTDIVKLLIKYEADIHLRNEWGEGLLFMAVQAESLELVQYFLNLKTLFFFPTFDINDTNNKGATPLDCALDKDNSQIVQLLKKYGAKKQTK